MKEITILALHLGVGGIEQYISSLCKMLENNYQINIISTYRGPNHPLVSFSDKINITYLINDIPNIKEFKQIIKTGKLVDKFKQTLKMMKLLYLKTKRNKEAIKKINSDYIITTRTFHNNLVSKFAKKGIITIATEHNYHNNDSKYISKLIKSLKNITYFVLVSKELYNFYKDKIGNTTAIYIPNVIDDMPDSYSLKNNHNLISIGRLEAIKGFDDLIDIIGLVKKKISDIKLFLIGDGTKKEELLLKIKTNKLENNIKLLGYLSKPEMKPYLLDSSLYIMTSHSESFGLVLLEAMSYKIPCIAFNSASGAREIIANNGFLIDNRDKQEMAKAIISLLNNQHNLGQLGEESYFEASKYLASNIRNNWFKLLK